MCSAAILPRKAVKFRIPSGTGIPAHPDSARGNQVGAAPAG